MGEVLWDVFPSSRRLGGAPLNFAAHARRLGHDVRLLSAVGSDEPGRQALERISALGLNTTFIQIVEAFPTGTAVVELNGEEASFKIQRPAAYDAFCLSERDEEFLRGNPPEWFYFGTLYASSRQGRALLEQLLNTLQGATNFYDLNLRPGYDSAELVLGLMERANVVKLNEEELQRVSEFAGLPDKTEAFCRQAVRRYGWHAVAVTLGSRGCALCAGGQYVEAPGVVVDVADPVGAGDAFAAAMMHGMSSKWPLSETAAFANRVGALVASREGAIPDWTMEEAVKYS